MNTTRFVRKEDVKHNWYLIDATDQPVGRIASMVAHLIRGKHHPDYTPHIDMGDHVIILNAKKVILTGKKLNQKMYYHHSGYPGGMKQISAKKLLDNVPEKLLTNAIKGMLPKGRLGRQLNTKVRIYPGSEHPHEAQNPIQIKFDENKYVDAVK
ncbi:50S ribosomal protein L13 [bacterium]|nr:50S ribosomal protein L13 [candidate division CSSED10-310 bacterium]